MLRHADVEWWLPCKILLYSYRRRRAVAALRLWFDPGVGTRRVLLFRDGGGNVFQVAGDVNKAATKEGYYRAELRIPWDAAVSLAALAKRTVKEGATNVLHNYVAWIKDASLPPLKLVYEGYVALRDMLIYKMVNVPAGYYFLELRFGGVPVLFPTKYYRHERKNRRAGGDSGAFAVPLDVLRTFHSWSLHELGADYDFVYAKVWKPQPSGGALKW
jgi:hypothetical protein